VEYVENNGSDGSGGGGSSMGDGEGNEQNKVELIPTGVYANRELKPVRGQYTTTTTAAIDDILLYYFFLLLLLSELYGSKRMEA